LRPEHRWEDNIKINVRRLRVWSEFMCLRRGKVAGCCDHGNEPSGSIQGWESLGQLSDH